MKYGKLILKLASVLILIAAVPSIAGIYYIGRDEGGFFFQTDSHGGWYIDHEDLRYFQPGQEGIYSTGKDANGTYIVTDTNHKFYIDMNARQEQVRVNHANNWQQDELSLAKQTKVIIKGNQVLVPVVLGYGSKKSEAMLLLDTGASITTIHRDIAKKLKITKTDKAKLMVPGGGIVQVDVAKLSYLMVGENKQANLYTAIIDHGGPAVDHQGLLGMDFLKNYRYRVDFGRQVIRWERLP